MENYTRWICHGEAHRAREEVVRQRIDDYDVEAGCADMLADFHEAHFQEVPREEPPEPTAKQYYDMLYAAQKPLHGHTNVFFWSIRYLENFRLRDCDLHYSLNDLGDLHLIL